MTHPRSGDTVRVHYTGRLDDGRVFASSKAREPLELTVGEGTPIPSVEETLTWMEPGEERTVSLGRAGDDRCEPPTGRGEPHLRFGAGGGGPSEAASTGLTGVQVTTHPRRALSCAIAAYNGGPARVRPRRGSSAGDAPIRPGRRAVWHGAEAVRRVAPAPCQRRLLLLLTSFRVRTTVVDMGSPRQSTYPREVVSDFRPPASRWLPRAFKNLGRGVF